MCYNKSIDKTKGHKTMTNKELNDCGFNIKRTEDLKQAITEGLKSSPYVDFARTFANDDEIQITFKPLTLINGEERKERITIAVNGTRPKKTSPFVPIYHTAQIALLVDNTPNGVQEGELLYPYVKDRLVMGRGGLYNAYDFGLYLDKGGKERLQEIAKDVTNSVTLLVSKYYLPYVKNAIKDFEESLR